VNVPEGATTGPIMIKKINCQYINGLLDGEYTVILKKDVLNIRKPLN
jgi:hypothetical protein